MRVRLQGHSLALTMLMKSGFSEAPPTRNPSISGWVASSRQFSPFTDPVLCVCVCACVLCVGVGVCVCYVCVLCVGVGVGVCVWVCVWVCVCVCVETKHITTQ